MIIYDSISPRVHDRPDLCHFIKTESSSVYVSYKVKNNPTNESWFVVAQ